MNDQALNQAAGLANLLERQPLAGFLALTILALMVMFGLFVREKSQHQKTLREVVSLTTTFARQWDHHMELEDRMLEHFTRSPYPSTSQERP